MLFGRSTGRVGHGVASDGVSDRRSDTLVRDLALYVLARFSLVAVITAILVLVQVPLLVGLVIGLVVGLPLGLLLFRSLNAKVTAGLAARNERRATERARLRAELRGERLDTDDEAESHGVDRKGADETEER
ncbi:hypothetical protein SaccyDRAFT_0378 [Saccharomonospora cyanea NA-134]|uniref:DUF4229 domain-containing protein n=1 Tax=Saccharomonospora cyanea NA-134 TaxID=882082 RepID=H5XET3_9PSEU|nr:hypothetical protein SaccyDRAFT_0378 [Saccharomonospora cyanea NA-134]